MNCITTFEYFTVDTTSFAVSQKLPFYNKLEEDNLFFTKFIYLNFISSFIPGACLFCCFVACSFNKINKKTPYSIGNSRSNQMPSGEFLNRAHPIVKPSFKRSENPCYTKFFRNNKILPFSPGPKERSRNLAFS